MIKPEDNTTVNITLKVANNLLVPLEEYLNNFFELVDFSVLADTKNMYENDASFKKIVKESKKIKDLRLQYINDNNHKYK